MTNRHKSGEEPQDLELVLRQFQPKSASISEAEVLYRCGWEAALASVSASAEPRKPASPHNRSLRPFLSGLVAGLAAAMLLMVSVRISEFENPSLTSAPRPPMKQTRESPVPESHTTQALDENAIEPPTPWEGSSFLASMFDWDNPIRSSSISSGLESEFDNGGLGSNGTYVLSTVARHSLASVLESPGGQGSSPNELPAVRLDSQRTRTLGEMLFEFSADDYY